MKKSLVALGVLLLVAGTAAATAFPDGYFQGSLLDRSSIFRDSAGSGNFSPIPTGGALAVGDEQRTSFVVDAMNAGTLEGGSPPGTKQVFSAGAVPYTNGALSGLLYDAVITGFKGGAPPGPGVTSDIYFNPGARYKSAEVGGGTDGTWTDTVVGAGSGILATTTLGYGIVVVIYDDPGLNTNFAGDGVGPNGQADWREPGNATLASPHPGAAVMSVPGVITNTDYFPTISDPAGSNTGVADSGTAVPWLVMVLGPLPAPFNTFYGVPAGTVLVERNFDVTSGAEGFAFGNIIGGTFANYMRTDVFGPGLDVRLDFDVSVPFAPPATPVLTSDGWQTRSDDPAQFGVIIPEPATMSLLGLGLAGIAALRRSRKK